MKRSAHMNSRPDFVVRAAPFRFRTFHGFDKGKYDNRSKQMFTLDRVLTLRMPYFDFPALADATIAELDRQGCPR